MARDTGLRLGLRQVDGLPEHVAAQLVAARLEGGPFADVTALRDRAGLGPAHVERLAAADCFGSLALPRRQALWNARTLDMWLKDPSAMVPWQQMDFQVPDPQERAHLIAYLKTLR